MWCCSTLLAAFKLADSSDAASDTGGSSDDSDAASYTGGFSDGSDAAVSDSVEAGEAGNTSQANLFLKTVSIVEAVFESLPQLILQVRAASHGKELSEWVFVFSVSVSGFCIGKAIVEFLLNREDIWEIFGNLQDRVYRFKTLEASDPPPGGRWKLATVNDVMAYPELLRDQNTSGLVDWYIANLADDMQVHGPNRNYYVEPNSAVLGHTLYALK